MAFTHIDLSKWKRKKYFDYYFTDVPCSYSMTLNVDITSLLPMIKRNDVKLYPCLIYLLSSIVNKHEEFRTDLDQEGRVGVHDIMHPSYAIFSNESETFTNIWTEYRTSFREFYDNYLADNEKYASVKEFMAKPDVPQNVFPISSIPWVTFTGFNLNLPKESNYLLPIFTIGKYFEQMGKIQLPLAIQVHHAVCDGFHLARFVKGLQEAIHQFEI